ncbi:hypothetical protein FACS189461_5230 [Spirochaetia bacterium]|nr:hypothetical protein FACS189461_5230 [Spirochaetia bacterium]
MGVLEIAEKIIHSVRKEETKSQLKLAAERLCADYKNDKELSQFQNCLIHH